MRSCQQRITNMSTENRKKRVAIIGGGVCGLVAARHLGEPSCGTEYTLFEQSGCVGGTWVYSEKTGEDEFGLPIHSSMYKSLRTNLPKECMMFPDFPHTKQGVSYLTSQEVLQYLEAYADHFNIRPYVRFRHHVKEVKPEGNKWKVHVVDVKNKQEHQLIFDAVVLATGHNSKPRYARLPGIDNFKGRLIHSHNYREPTPFRDQRVLIIGAGPSGLDMTFDLSTVTDHVTLSHHTDYASKVGFPPKVILKPDVEQIDEDGFVIFKDGSKMDFDIIAFCTGYQYTYPFLAEDCGITIEDNYVSPLYKSIVNINNPTMGFLGVLRHTPTFYIADLQIRYFLKTLLHPEVLPSREEMLSELQLEEKASIENGFRKCDYHLLGERSQKYMDDICQISGAPVIPPIILRMYFHGYERVFSDFKNFRYNYYKIIDKEKFTVVDLREITAKPVQRIHNNPSCRCGSIDTTREIY